MPGGGYTPNLSESMLLTASGSGFFTTSIIFFTLNKLFPVAGMGEYDEVDTYGTLTSEEAAKLGVMSNEQSSFICGENTAGSATQVSEMVDTKERSIST